MGTALVDAASYIRCRSSLLQDMLDDDLRGRFNGC